MAIIKTEIRSGAYFDSVVLMQLQRSLAEISGVDDAGVVMGTKANLDLLEQTGLLVEEIKGVKADDLVLVVKAKDAKTAQDVLAQAKALMEKLGQRFHAVISDMAPNTTGNKDVDAARSFHLCEAAFNLSQEVLTPNGVFVCKIFQGELFQEFSDKVKSHFKRQHIFKPQSSRKASKEIFIVGIGKIDL